MGSVSWNDRKIMSLLWPGTRKDQIVRGGITPVHLATPGILTGFLAGRLAIMWTWILQSFGAIGRRLIFFFILPKRNNSSES